MTTIDLNVNDYILKKMTADVQYVMVYSCVFYVCVCVILCEYAHLCMTADSNQISLFPCWAFSLHLVFFLTLSESALNILLVT